MNFQNILIFRIGHLGDTVVALPALWAIREAFPAAELSYLTNIDLKNKHYISPKDVLPESGLIDNWIAYPTNLNRVKSARSFLSLSRKLRRGKFDALIYLMPRIRSSRQIDRDRAFFRISGISNIIGMGYLKEHHLELPIPKPVPTVESESDFLLNLLSDAGVSIPDDERKTDLLLTADEISFARNLVPIEACSQNSNTKMIAVAPGSKWRSKIWSEKSYEKTVYRLIAEENCYPIIFGGVEDREKGDRLVSAWGTGFNAAGKLKVRESAALLADCHFYLGNDTGTMHLAAAVKTPCVAMFAAIDWRERWVPFGDRNAIFRKAVECEGCNTPDCFNNHLCLNLIEEEEVYNACVKMIGYAKPDELKN